MRWIVIGFVCLGCTSSTTEPVAQKSSAIVQSPWLLAPQGTPKNIQGDHTATLVNETKLAVLGGSVGVDGTPTDAAWVITHDPKAHTFDAKPAGNLVQPRGGHTATLLPSGKILVAGGYGDAAGTPRMSAEIVDPTTAKSTLTAPMSAARVHHGAVLLSNGKVLVVGGRGPDPSAELFDPATSTWSAAPDMATGRMFATLTTLKDGRVLVVGGGLMVKSAEIFDPASSSWKPAGDLADPRFGHVAALLPSGKVIVAGGFPLFASTEIFDPATSKWTSSKPMPIPRGNAAATVLSNGVVMVTGGRLDLTPLAYVDHYDETIGDWRLGTPMFLPHTLHTATTFPSGDVLVVGSAYAEKFHLIPTGVGCTQAADCTAGFCVDDVCCGSACTGGCERCDTNGAKGTCTPVSGEFNHCEPGNTCIKSKCVPSAGTTCSADRLATVTKTGETKSCAPYVCDQSVGACFSECTTSNDCAAGFACDGATKQCTGVQPSDGSSGGCATTTTGATSGLASSLLAFVGLLGWRARRIRRRSR